MRKTNNWATTKLMAVVGISVLRFICDLLFFRMFVVASGAILSGIGLLVISPFFIVLVALVADAFGAAMLYNTLLFFLLLPFPSVWPQLFNIFAMPFNGIVIDFLKKICNNNLKLFSFIAGFLFTMVVILETIALYFTVGLSYTQNFPNFLLNPFGLGVMTLLFSLVGGVSGYGAYLTYGKILKTSVIKRIQKK